MQRTPAIIVLHEENMKDFKIRFCCSLEFLIEAQFVLEKISKEIMGPYGKRYNDFVNIYKKAYLDLIKSNATRESTEALK